MCVRERAPPVPRHFWLGCAALACVLGLGFRLCPASPGWGVWLCVFVCSLRLDPPTPGWAVCGVGVFAWARVSAAPGHSWLGCWGVCALVCALCFYPAIPGLGVRCGCVCVGSGSGCTQSFLAGVLGCVCVCASALPILRHSWLGCAVCVCGLGLGNSAAPRLIWLGCWGVRVCVLAPLVTRHSWLGCAACLCVLGLEFRLCPASPGWGFGVCVSVSWFRLCPATPGWAARYRWVCLGSCFGCARPLLVGVLWCVCARFACTPPPLAGVCCVGVCAWTRVSAAPCHSWLWCWGVRALVCALRFYPASAGWGVRCRCVCLGSGFGCAPPLQAGVSACVCVCVRAPLVPRHSWLRLCGVGACAWALVLAASNHPWPGRWGVCAFACALLLCPATPGWGVWCWCVCLGSGFGCAPPLLAGVLGPVRVCVRAPLVPRHSWLGCVVWVCLLGLGFRLRPASPGWGVGVCVRLRARSACTLPLLAGVCGVGACAWARGSAAPRLSWLGCRRVCAFACALCFYPASPGSGVRCRCVCLGSDFGCAPPLPAGVLACVCVYVRALLVPRHSWLGCAVSVRVLRLGFRLLPTTPGWGARACVCLRARSSCVPPLLARVCGVGVCAWARFSAAPRQSWLGCWGMCVFACALLLYPATPGWAVWCGCVCLGSDFGCAPPLLAGLSGCVCVCVRTPLVPCHSRLGCVVSVRVLGLGCRLRPASPGWGVGACVYVCVLAPLVPRHSWLGCVVWLGVLGLRFRLRPASPGWGVGVCVRLRARFSCTLPLLAGVCGVGARAWALVSAAPRYSWPGFALGGFGVAWHLFLCRGSLRVVRAARVCGTRWPLLLGTCLCALVVAGSWPLWRALWPRFGAPRLVRSGRSRCSGQLSRRRGASPHPGGLRPGFYWAAARGTRRPVENGAHCACRWPLPRQGRWAHSASYPVGAPRWGCPWRVPPASILGCVRCGGWRVWTRSLTRPVSQTARLPTGDSVGAPGLFRLDADTAPFGSEDATPGSRACVHVRALLGRVGQAGLPGAFWCASPFPVAGFAVLFVCSATPGLGLLFFSFVRPGCLWGSLFLGPGCLGPWRLAAPPSPPLFFFSCHFYVPPFFFRVRPRCLRRSVFPSRGALGLGVFLSPPPPAFFFFFSGLFFCRLFPAPLFFSSPAFFFPLCAPVASGVRCVVGRGSFGLGVLLSPPPPPPTLWCFFFFLFFFLLFSSSVPCRWCGAGLVCVS